MRRCPPCSARTLPGTPGHARTGVRARAGFIDSVQSNDSAAMSKPSIRNRLGACKEGLFERHVACFTVVHTKKLAASRGSRGGDMALLQDKVAVITGGTAGLGLGIGEAFLNEGAKVVLMGRRAEKGEKTVAELGAGD